MHTHTHAHYTKHSQMCKEADAARGPVVARFGQGAPAATKGENILPTVKPQNDLK